MFSTGWAVCDPPVKVVVVVLSFTPEIEEQKTQEEGEDQEAKTATLHLDQHTSYDWLTTKSLKHYLMKCFGSS